MEGYLCLRFLGVLAIAGITSALNGQVLTAEKIAEKLRPSTVLIENLEGGGTGVVLTEAGLILTNHHVIGSGIDLKVRLQMRFGNKLAVTELDQVKLLKVHPKYDLAVLQAVAPEGAAFVPVQMASKLDAVATGSQCYVIGNPGGPDGSALEMSITEGLVSSASRNLEGLDYIQVSAAMNPGNSGGPVCNEYGRCIGIATWKMTQTEGIGFAIPAHKVVLSEFIEPKDKPKNLALARELENYAAQFMEAAEQTAGAEQQVLLQNAIQIYRLTLAAAPNDSSPYHNLGLAYQNLGSNSVAKKYFEAALKLSPGSATTLHSLGVILIQEGNQNEARCLDLWLQGTGDLKDKSAAALCAEDVAVTAMNKGKFHAAGYALQWSHVLEGRPPERSHIRRQNMWSKVQSQMNAGDFAAIRGLTGPFGREIFERLLKGEPISIVQTTPVAAPSTPGKPGEPSPAPGVTLSIPSAEQMSQLAAQASAKFKGTQQTIPPEGLDLPLPDIVRDPILGNSGWQLILPFKNIGKIGVFNLAANKFDGFVDCVDPAAKCASGGNVMAVYLPSTKTLELYDLNTLQRRVAQRLELKTHLAYLGMGLLNPLQITALCEPLTFEGIPNYIPAIIRLPGFSVYYPPMQKAQNNAHMAVIDRGESLEGGMDESGAVCAARRYKVSPTGYAVYTLSGDGNVLFNAEHKDSYNPRPSFFGSAVVSGNQVMLDGQTKNMFEKGQLNWRGAILAPIAGYAGFVARVKPKDSKDTTSGFQLYGLPRMNPLIDIPADKSVHGEASFSHTIEGPYLLASAYCDRLISIVPQTKRLRIFALGLGASAGRSDVAQPGKLFQRKLQLPEGATVTLENGPKGMTLDAATLTLSWQIPEDAATGQTVQAILLVKTADGKQDYQIEKVLVP